MARPGEYPALSLESAREKASAWLLLVKQGKDPAVVEEQARLAEIQKQRKAKDNTFAAVAEAWFKAKLSKERKGRQVEVGVRSNLFKWADRPISEITEDDVFALVKRKAATSHHRTLATSLGTASAFSSGQLTSAFTG